MITSFPFDQLGRILTRKQCCDIEKYHSLLTEISMEQYSENNTEFKNKHCSEYTGGWYQPKCHADRKYIPNSITLDSRWELYLPFAISSIRIFQSPQRNPDGVAKQL